MDCTIEDFMNKCNDNKLGMAAPTEPKLLEVMHDNTAQLEEIQAIIVDINSRIGIDTDETIKKRGDNLRDIIKCNCEEIAWIKDKLIKIIETL